MLVQTRSVLYMDCTWRHWPPSLMSTRGNVHTCTRCARLSANNEVWLHVTRTKLERVVKISRCCWHMWSYHFSRQVRTCRRHTWALGSETNNTNLPTFTRWRFIKDGGQSKRCTCIWVWSFLYSAAVLWVSLNAYTRWNPYILSGWFAKKNCFIPLCINAPVA